LSVLRRTVEMPKGGVSQAGVEVREHMVESTAEDVSSTQYSFQMEVVRPADGPDVSDAQRSIDALVADAQRYRSSAAFSELLRFVGEFRFYAPFNAMLIHLQLPGAQFVAPAHRWRDEYGRHIKPGERALVILQPFGPVMFVYDVAQTEPGPHARPLPSRVEHPFAMPPMRGVTEALDMTVDNAKLDGVRVSSVAVGSSRAGCIRGTASGVTQEVHIGRSPARRVQVPVRYEIELSRAFSPTERYATLAHELAHLYCGHLGTPHPKWWPSRTRLDPAVQEFEAESAAFIACLRIDPHARMPPYLADYLRDEQHVPPIGFDRVLKASGEIIRAGQRTAKPREAWQQVWGGRA
jgi:IrrE N-terminal-like domain